MVAADGSLGKTFYATHDGEYFTSFYFLTSGTETEDTMGSQKRIMDGQLMIIRQGKTYNAQGSCVE